MLDSNSISAPVYFLTGPTASGKTALAIELAQRFPVEIISVDSAMVYKGMDIGTAKPTIDEQKLAPHHLIDCCSVEQSYSAGQFYYDALLKIKQIHASGAIPLCVGGSMLYFNLLANGMPNLPEADLGLRQDLQDQAQQHGLQSLYLQLKSNDPVAASKINPQDKKRIIRALEIYNLTGMTQQQIQSKTISPLQNKIKKVILMPENRRSLDSRIKSRIDSMFAAGLLQEVESLKFNFNVTAESPAMQAVAYKQLWGYLSGKGSLEEVKELIFIATRRLAKHQLTWTKKWDFDCIIDCMDERCIVNGIKYFSSLL